MSDYVSPIDDAAVTPLALAERPSSLDGRRVVLLDISKPQGDRFLDRVEDHLRADGAVTHRITKPTFSRRAPGEVIEQVKIHGDLAIEGLAD